MLARPIPRYVLEAFLRVAPDTLSTVAFIGIEGDGGLFTPIGTASFVYRNIGEFAFVFAMTASHVVDNLTEDSQAKLAIRVNRKDGAPADVIRLSAADRISHPVRANDISLFPIQIDPAVFEFSALEISRERLTANREGTSGTMAGDHVCAVGLYTSHHGQLSNIPVLRTGNIAAMPKEPLWTPRGFLEAYLIDLRTIAGLSGSPVFQTTLPVRIKDGQPEFRRNDNPNCSLIGMLLGYHAVEYKEDQIEVPRYGAREASANDLSYSSDERNTGFGVVVMIERLFDIFETKAFEDAATTSLNRFAYKGYREAEG